VLLNSQPQPRCLARKELASTNHSPFGGYLQLKGITMKSAFMPMGFKTNDGYIVSDVTVQQLQQFFKEEIQLETSPSDILRIVDVFKTLEREKLIA